MKNSNETKLLEYLANEVINTNGFIKRASNTLNRITQSNDIHLEMYDKGQTLLDDIQSYRFRLMWLQSQINQIKELNK